MEYIILNSHTLDGLVTQVNTKLKEGWVLYRDFQVWNFIHYQTMTKTVNHEHGTKHINGISE